VNHKYYWNHEWPRPRHNFRSKRSIFLRVVGFLGLLTLLVVAGLGVLAFLLTRFFGGSGQTAMYVWVGGCILAILLPVAIFWVVRRAFQTFGAPLLTIMAAADAVAEGDLTVRVSEHYPAEFGQLAHSFNRMTAELARADQQRRHLTADVAHELRTPLHIIQGNLEGILDGVYQPSQSHITATLEETQLLARLVDDLQTLSLAEAGQLTLHWETVDIKELLADVQTSFSGQAEVAGLELPLEITGEPAQLTIQADRGRLDQVFGNLVANAIRHTPAGGKITLRVEPLTNGIRARVIDTGEGIKQEDLPYVFDRFWRGDHSRSRQDGSGSGLGLAISRQLVQAHGGKISVESLPGKGTAFTVELPRERGESRVETGE
jgi:two-component system sensor histidine kinase BaeS